MYEPGTTRLFHEYLKDGDSCVIAGAHQGYFTTLAAAIVGPRGRVYAFEPEPKNFALLKQNTEMFDNVRLFHFALGEKEQDAPFFFNSDNDGGHALYDPAQFSTNTKTKENPIVFKVSVKRLDDVLEDEDLSNLKLMLFDVEGAEHSLLKGAINTIVDNNVPYIITEINTSALAICQTSQMALRSYMSIYGYRPHFIDDAKADLIPTTEEVVVEHEGHRAVFNILFKHLTAK